MFHTLLVAWAVCVAPAEAERLPRPGVGVYFRAEDVAAMREKIRREPCLGIYEARLKRTDAAMAAWPGDCEKLRIRELAPQLPDLTMEFVPAKFSPPGGKEAGKALERYAAEDAPWAAFVYLMTGERRYADFAWDVFRRQPR